MSDCGLIRCCFVFLTKNSWMDDISKISCVKKHRNRHSRMFNFFSSKSIHFSNSFYMTPYNKKKWWTDLGTPVVLSFIIPSVTYIGKIFTSDGGCVKVVSWPVLHRIGLLIVSNFLHFQQLSLFKCFIMVQRYLLVLPILGSVVKTEGENSTLKIDNKNGKV